MMICPVCRADEHPAVKMVDHEALKIDLPKPLRLRAEMARLTRPEFDKEYVAATGDTVNALETPGTSVQAYRADDGLVFLVDNLGMSLWLHEQDGWHPLLQGVHVFKTFGGMPAHLPVQYLRRGFFAVTQTVPGTVKEEKQDRIPQAQAVTFLLDSRQGKIVARSENFIYSENPPVKIPENWAKLISATKINQSQGDNQHSATAPKPDRAPKP